MNMIKNFNKIDINEFSLQENDKKEEKEENVGNIDLYGEKLEEKEITYKNLMWEILIYMGKNWKKRK